jgi:8-hydroxy-5-deazaflavin:NADPH oxidoreductase
LFGFDAKRDETDGVGAPPFRDPRPQYQQEQWMSIGIIGAGALGSSVARLLARSGIAATIANRRGPQSLAGLVGELGPSIKAGTAREAASADIVVVAVRWVDLEKALGGLPPWNGRIVIDAANAVAFLDPDSPDAKDPSNPLAAYGIKAIDLGAKHSSQAFRAFVPGARIVKAFNHLDASVLPEPTASGGQRVLFYSGDDAAAKAEVRKLIEQTGFSPIDLGGLDVGGPLASLPFGALAAGNFIKI